MKFVTALIACLFIGANAAPGYEDSCPAPKTVWLTKTAPASTCWKTTTQHIEHIKTKYEQAPAVTSVVKQTVCRTNTVDHTNYITKTQVKTLPCQTIKATETETATVTKCVTSTKCVTVTVTPTPCTGSHCPAY